MGWVKQNFSCGLLQGKSGVNRKEENITKRANDKAVSFIGVNRKQSAVEVDSCGAGECRVCCCGVLHGRGDVTETPLESSDSYQNANGVAASFVRVMTWRPFLVEGSQA